MIYIFVSGDAQVQYWSFNMTFLVEKSIIFSNLKLKTFGGSFFYFVTRAAEKTWDFLKRSPSIGPINYEFVKLLI